MVTGHSNHIRHLITILTGKYNIFPVKRLAMFYPSLLVEIGPSEVLSFHGTS